MQKPKTISKRERHTIWMEGRADFSTIEMVSMTSKGTISHSALSRSIAIMQGSCTNSRGEIISNGCGFIAVADTHEGMLSTSQPSPTKFQEHALTRMQKTQ